MKTCKLDLLVKPGEKNINGILYEKESYITALKEYINKFKFLYIKDKTIYPYNGGDLVRFSSGRPDLYIGEVIELNEDYSI
jgi:hypothetical protein